MLPNLGGENIAVANGRGEFLPQVGSTRQTIRLLRGTGNFVETEGGMLNPATESFPRYHNFTVSFFETPVFFFSYC